MRTCTVCSWPPRTRNSVDKCLVAGMTYTKVAEKFNRPNRPITRSAITRHSKHVLTPGPEGHRPRGGEPGPTIPGQSLLERVEGLIAECRAIVERAMNTDQLVAATGALREQRSLLELCAKLSGELASANVNFFAMELTEDRIQDFLDAAALRGPQVGTFVRQEVTKRFGTVAPSFVVNFVKPTPSDASSGPTLNSDYPLLPAGEVVPGADELLLDSERQQILTKLPISPAVGR